MPSKLDVTRPWAWESRLTARKRNLGQFQRVADSIKGMVEGGDYEGASRVVQASTPDPEPPRRPAWQTQVGEAVKAQLAGRAGARVGRSQPTGGGGALGGDAGVRAGEPAMPDEDGGGGGGGFLGGLHKAVGLAVRGTLAAGRFAVEGIKETASPVVITDDQGQLVAPTRENVSAQNRRLGERAAGRFEMTPQDYISGNSFLNEVGAGVIPRAVNRLPKDVGGIPVRTPASFAVDTVAAPATFLTAGAGGVVGGGGRIGFKAIGAAVAKQLAKEAAAGATAGAATQVVDESLPENTPPWLRIGANVAAGLAGGVAGYKAADNPVAARDALNRNVARLQGREGRLPAIGLGIEDVSGEVPPVSRITGQPLDPEPMPLDDVPGPQQRGKYTVPAVGQAGADQAIADKGAVYQRSPLAGAWGPIRKASAALSPAVGLDKDVLVAYRASNGVKAQLRTAFDSATEPHVRAVEKAVTDTPPVYIGPVAKNDAQKRLIGTVKDIADRPEAYTISPALRAALDDLDNANWHDVAARVRGEYSGDQIFPYTGQNRDGYVFLPTLRTSETEADQIAASLVTISGSRGAKTKVFRSAWERAAEHPDFKAETDLGELIARHNEGMAANAADNTFKLGAGGKTLTEVMEELHPELVRFKQVTREGITSIRGKLVTAEQRFRGAAMEQTDVTRAQAAAGARHERLAAAVAALGDDYGPELSHLAGQAYEARLQYERMARMAARAGEAAYWAKSTQIRALRDSLKMAEDTLHNLVKAYKAAEIDPEKYLREPQTQRFYSPEAAKSVNSVLSRPAGVGKKAVAVLDEVRASHLAGDASPLTIQGQLAILSSPVNTAKAIKEVLGEDPLAVLRNIATTEAEDVADYAFATGRPFGRQAYELSVSQGKRGVGRIPGVKPLEDRMFAIVELASYRGWKADRDLLLKWNPERDRNWANNAAARTWEKVIPSLSPAERGVSQTRAAVERAVLTSASFAISPAVLLREAVTGLAKLGANSALKQGFAWSSLSGTEQLAIRRVLTFAATTATISGATAAVSANSRGLSVEEAVKRAVFDPTAPEWMSVQFGEGRRISIGGPMRGFLRAILPDRNGVPFAGLPDWARGKLNTAPRLAMDFSRNADFRGNQIVSGNFPENVLRALAYAVESSAPLTLGEAMEQVRTGTASAGSLASGVGSQLAGTNYIPPSPLERLNQRARDRFDGREYFDLSPSEKKTIRDDNPQLYAEYVARASDRTQAAEREKSLTLEQQKADDDLLLSGKLKLQDWGGATDDRRNQLIGAERVIYADAKGGRKDRVLDPYFAEIDANQTNGRVDWEAIDAYTAGLPAADRQYIKENTGLTKTPLQRLKRDLNDQYREIPRYRGYTADEASKIDELWQEARNRSRGTEDAQMLRALRQVDLTGYDARVVRGVRRRILGSLTELELRSRWMRTHPEGVILTGRGTLAAGSLSAIQAALAKQK